MNGSDKVGLSTVASAYGDGMFASGHLLLLLMYVSRSSLRCAHKRRKSSLTVIQTLRDTWPGGE